MGTNHLHPLNDPPSTPQVLREELKDPKEEFITVCPVCLQGNSSNPLPGMQQIHSLKTTRWAQKPVINESMGFITYNPYKYRVITPVGGVIINDITPFITGRGPSCMYTWSFQAHCFPVFHVGVEIPVCPFVGIHYILRMVSWNQTTTVLGGSSQLLYGCFQK